MPAYWNIQWQSSHLKSDQVQTWHDGKPSLDNVPHIQRLTLWETQERRKSHKVGKETGTVNPAPKPRWIFFFFVSMHCKSFPQRQQLISLADLAPEQPAWQVGFSLAFKDILSMLFISCKCMKYNLSITLPFNFPFKMEFYELI